MYFNQKEPPQPSTHAVSKPIDILRTSTAYQTREPQHGGYHNPAEKQRPVNRVKPIKNPAFQNSSISSNSSASSTFPSLQQPLNIDNKENCNRLPVIYSLYGRYLLWIDHHFILANPSPRTMPVDALTRSLYNYISTTPNCSCISANPNCSCSGYFSDDEDRTADESDVLMPTEFRSIGDIIGCKSERNNPCKHGNLDANVVKSQRQQTMDRFNSTMNQFNSAWSTLRRDMQMRRDTAQM